jgi:CP family cyanate transporter-like MFS transporter
VGYLLAAAVPPTLGALHDASGGWQVPLLTLGGIIVAALVFAVLGSRDRVVE